MRDTAGMMTGTQTIALIRGTDSIALDDALDVLDWLIPVVEAAPHDAEARAAATSVISRMPRDELAAVVLDWWFVVTTNGPSPLGWVHHLPDWVPEPLRSAMAGAVELSHSGLSVPVGSWIQKRRSLLRLLDGLDNYLDLDWYGKSKLPGEREAWAWLQTELEPTVSALRERRPTETFVLDRRALERELDRTTIEMNSRRWNELIKRAEECVAGVNRIVAVHSIVQPWIPRADPPHVEETPKELVDAVRHLSGHVVWALIDSEEAPWRSVSHRVAERLTAISQGLTESDLSWLASVTDGWFAETSDLSPKVAVPALEQATARRHSIEREIADLRAAGIDADEADLLLMEHDLSGAQRAIRELRELRQLTRQSEALMSKLAELRREASGKQAVPENWMPRVDEAAASLASGEIETAKRQVNVLELDLRRTRRADEIDGLMRLRVDLVALAAPAVVLAEIDAHLADLDADGDTRVNRELQQRLIERLDALRNQRNAETLDLRARIHDLLETGSDVLLDTDRHDFELQLAEIENLIAVEDIMGARRLATDVLAAIQDKRVLQWRREDGESSLVHHVVSFCTQELDFAEDDVRRLYVAAKTKPFVILAGLTGSGKSTIARLFAAALGADARNGRFRRIAVRPDWIDQSDVLGLVNPISNRFEPGWLAIIARQCERNLDQLHVVLLDEMNLAPVEQYLAEYLSALEEARSGSDSTRLPLYSEGAEPVNRDEWPSSLPFPRNLIVIGTVNVDETTRVLSERVLDRANVLQLSIAMSSAHHGATSTPVRPWHVPFSEWDAICINRPDPSHHDFLVVVGDVLHSIGIGVGARAHVELERFLANAVGVVPADIALDLGVLQRIIPKIRGFKRDLTNGLDELLEKLEKQSCHRSARVVARWLEPSVSDDEFLDGTDARIGLLR